ncbi:hypothetical protein [Polaromonas aquatica]|uniref:hypothetical protein n=1 Tax=Polaromonas aquatica TaxID=332657 RepID=UPI003D651CD4
MAALATAANADPNLVGQWKSDSELSMRFNNERAKLDSKTALFLSQLMGHMTLTFTTDTLTSDLPDLETKTQEGRKRPFTGFRETHPYRVLAVASDSVAIKTVAPVTGRDAIVLYNFIGPDMLWVYAGGEDNSQSLHLREYFVRVKTSNQSNLDTPAGARGGAVGR